MAGPSGTSIAAQFFQALKLAHGAGAAPYCWPAGLPVPDDAGTISMGDEWGRLILPDNSQLLQKFNECKEYAQRNPLPQYSIPDDTDPGGIYAETGIGRRLRFRDR